MPDTILQSWRRCQRMGVAAEPGTALEPLPVPRLRELRDRAVRAEFDTITRDHPAVHAVTQLARKYRLTDRHIWRLLNRVDRETLPQARLF